MFSASLARLNQPTLGRFMFTLNRLLEQVDICPVHPRNVGGNVNGADKREPDYENI
jgi:hypothetical protein